LERTDGSILDYATVPLPTAACCCPISTSPITSRVETALRERAEASKPPTA